VQSSSAALAPLPNWLPRTAPNTPPSAAEVALPPRHLRCQALTQQCPRLGAARSRDTHAPAEQRLPRHAGMPSVGVSKAGGWIGRSVGVVPVNDLIVRVAVVLVAPMAVMLLVFPATRVLRAVAVGLGPIGGSARAGSGRMRRPPPDARAMAKDSERKGRCIQGGPRRKPEPLSAPRAAGLRTRLRCGTPNTESSRTNGAPDPAGDHLAHRSRLRYQRRDPWCGWSSGTSRRLKTGTSAMPATKPPTWAIHATPPCCPSESVRLIN
jgi:hypothetical protein